MNHCQKIFIGIVGIIVLFSPILNVLAVSGETGINLQVTSSSVCDNDGVCETGENETNCPADCGCNNNGVCE